MNYDPDSTDLEWGIEWDEYFDGRHPSIQVSTLCIGKEGGAFLVDLPTSNPHVSMWVNTPFEQKDLGPMVKRIRSEPDHLVSFNRQGEQTQHREAYKDAAKGRDIKISTKSYVVNTEPGRAVLGASMSPLVTRELDRPLFNEDVSLLPNCSESAKSMKGIWSRQG